MGLNSTGFQLGIAIEFKGPTSDDVIPSDNASLFASN
jgi:hypothetical protein